MTHGWATGIHRDKWDRAHSACGRYTEGDTIGGIVECAECRRLIIARLTARADACKATPC